MTTDQSPTKHTEPWEIQLRARKAASGVTLYSYHIARQSDSLAEAEANRFLIASAPDLLRQRDELADALASVLASAYPNASDHPAMFEAWVKGRTALRKAGRLQ